MKKLWRLTLFVLATIFLVLLTAACSSTSDAGDGAERGDKTIKMFTNIVGGKTPEENDLFIEEIERLTGIKVEMTKPPSDYDQKLLTALSSGETYDLILMTKPTMDILVDQGALMDLTEKIQESEILSDPTVIPPEEWELITYEDGKIYSVFNKFEGGTMPIVRQDWMEKLGFEEPKTLDDFYKIFKAFKEQDPDGNGKDDTYGLSISKLYDIQPFLSATGVKYRYVIDDEGNRTIPIATEAAVPVLEWLNKLYEEGLLDPDFATNDTTQMREKFLADKVGMVTYWDMWVGLFNNIKLTEDPNTEFRAKGIAGAVGPDGNIIHRRGDPSVWAIPVNAENPDVAFEFLEFWHTEEGNILSTLGIKDYDYTVDENGNYELTDIGKEHGMDHGVVIPQNTNFVNPIGLNPGVEEALEITKKYATPEISGPDWSKAEEIIENYALKAIMGDIPAQEAVKQMHTELLNAGLIDK